MTSTASPDGMAPGADRARPEVRTGHITALVRDALGVEVTDPTADLLSTGVIDSLAFVSLLLAIEQEFRISVDVEWIDLDDVRSVASITRFVNRELQGSTVALTDDHT